MLTVLLSITAVVAFWVSCAVDQVARGLVGSMFGVPFLGMTLSGPLWLPVAAQGSTQALGAGALATMVLAGAAAMVLLSWGLLGLVRAMHSSGWLRAFALEWRLVSLLWLPAAATLAVIPGGHGPAHELYTRLGPPMAGRWTALALGLVAIFLAASSISEAAVGVGRAWMRADALEFRRRLVRVTAGWPAVTAVFVLAYGAAWAPSPWALLPGVLGMLALQVQTR